MTSLQAVVLAIVQAVTEFLPISSSGHLILVPRFLGWPDQGLAFDVATHAGTLLAVLVYFRNDVIDLIQGFLTGKPRSMHVDFAPRPLAWQIILATIPAGVAGLLFKDWIAGEARNPILIACTAIFYGLLLGWADKRGEKYREIGSMTVGIALIIGVAQALALVPGTSRSGITMTAALLIGFTRPAAARFSFLLSIPITAAACALDFVDVFQGAVDPGQYGLMALGAAVSAVAGYAVIAGLLAWLRRQPLTVFVVYRVILGLVILATFGLGL
ncbi:MAG: undecaprenyl-diphosphatase [Acidobacteriota bacterium]|jgi:undecaprenyl-diphosphatase|nr:undecaprenyl-diphosphatase [Acidobacteriota bacterium]